MLVLPSAEGLAPVDLLLLMAAGENDAPRVAELIRAGADTGTKVNIRACLGKCLVRAPMEAWFLGWYISHCLGQRFLYARAYMRACKRLPGVQAMQSEGLPTCREALCVLGWSCEQA